MSRPGLNRPRRSGGPVEAGDVPFPVTPMLDMAFQLLAFFILTFQAPSSETRIDLYLPAAPAALPRRPGAEAPPKPQEDLGLETDLMVLAEADPAGHLRRLVLAGTPVVNAEKLGERLKAYVALVQGQPVRVRLLADDGLRYEEAARLIGAMNLAGVASIRLAAPIGAGGGP